jgi:channel protein (hemolysin III family)
MSSPGILLSIPGFNDPISSLTHLVGALVFAWLSVSLVRRGRGNLGRVVSLIVFAFSCVLLLSISGVYHLLSPGGAGRDVLQRLDHAAIFVLIAGSFTPVHAILFRGPWRWAMLTGVWAVALTGLTLKTVYFTSMPEWFGLALYLGFGWLGVVSWVGLARRFSYRFVRPVLWGALAYTFGALTDFMRWPVPVPEIVGPHELFHLAVLAGISFHWTFIRSFASGEIPSRSGGERIGYSLPFSIAPLLPRRHEVPVPPPH